MLPEYWAETRLWFSRLDGQLYQRLLLSVVKTSTQELETAGDLVSFHFLFEPDPHALFRIRLSSETGVEKAKQIVRRNIEQVRDFVVVKADQSLFGDYKGETEHFGEDGWQLAQKIFEMGTRMAIARADTEFKKSKGFDVGKIVHCMMNPNFGQEEYNFHLEQFIGRVMLGKRKSTIDQEVEQEVKRLLDAKLQLWKGAQFQTL
jgi:hypothetical protein